MAKSPTNADIAAHQELVAKKLVRTYLKKANAIPPRESGRRSAAMLAANSVREAFVSFFQNINPDFDADSFRKECDL